MSALKFRCITFSPSGLVYPDYHETCSIGLAIALKALLMIIAAVSALSFLSNAGGGYFVFKVSAITAVSPWLNGVLLMLGSFLVHRLIL